MFEQLFKVAVLAGLAYIAVITKEIRKQMPLTRQQVIDAISASTADVKAHMTAAGARVTTTVNELTAEIEELKGKVGDPLTQEDVDSLVAAQADVIKAADDVDPSTPPPTPITPPAPVEPPVTNP